VSLRSRSVDCEDGAYGKPPSDTATPPYDPARPPSMQFGQPVHCVKLAKDGLLYVCDRHM
jgi:hypothetical protein